MPRTARGGQWISDTAQMVAGKATGWIASTTASPSPLGLQWKFTAGKSDWRLDPLLTVTEMSAAELAAARAAAEAETQRSLAIRAVRVAGHVGKQTGKMGVYALDATHSPKRGMNVYSKKGVSGVHMYYATDGRWYVTVGTDVMVSGKASGRIYSTTASPSPLGLQWKYYDGTAFHLDPLLTVTEMSAAELAAARAAAEAETQRSLVIPAVRVSGHVGVASGEMEEHVLDAAHSPKRGKNVCSLVGTKTLIRGSTIIRAHLRSCCLQPLVLLCRVWLRYIAWVYTIDVKRRVEAEKAQRDAKKKLKKQDIATAKQTSKAKRESTRAKAAAEYADASDKRKIAGAAKARAKRGAAAKAAATARERREREKRRRKAESAAAAKAATAQREAKEKATAAKKAKKQQAWERKKARRDAEAAEAAVRKANARAEAEAEAAAQARAAAEAATREREQCEAEAIAAAAREAAAARAEAEAGLQARAAAAAAAAMREREQREAEAIAAAAREEDDSDSSVDVSEFMLDLLEEPDAATPAAAAATSAATSAVPPDKLLCPITLELFVDPVVAADGETYERSEIETWFAQGNTTAPLTNEELPSTALLPNKGIWRDVQAWKETHQE